MSIPARHTYDMCMYIEPSDETFVLLRSPTKSIVLQLVIDTAGLASNSKRYLGVLIFLPPLET